MNILFINATYGIGSTGTIISGLCDFLTKNGHNCFVACQKSNTKSKNIFIIGNKIDWKIHALKSRLFGDQAFHSTLPTKRIKKIIKSNKIDLVNIHNIHSNFINFHVLLKILIKMNIPVVFTLHDCWFFTGKCFHYIDANCDRFKQCCSKCPKLRSSPTSFFFDRTNQLLARKKKDYEKIGQLYVVACSNWIASEAKQSILSCAKDICVIQNGIDIKIFNLNTDDQNQTNKIRILGMANKFRIPQNATLIRELFNDGRFDITVCGCSDRDFEYFLSLSSKPHLIPIQKRPEAIKDIYTSADVFLNLTFADTFPTVNLESICCGTPVVAFDRGGAAEVITDCCGEIIKNDNYECVKACIISASKMDRKKCSEYGKKHFSELNSYKKYMDYFVKIHEERK